jgi:ATP synthase protein I
MSDDRRRAPERGRDWRGMRIAVEVSTVGLTLGLSVGIGVVMGVWLDRKFNTGGLLVILFSLLGVAAGFRQLIRTVVRINRDQERIERERRDRERAIPEETPAHDAGGEE